MAALPHPPDAAAERGDGDSGFEVSAFEHSLGRRSRHSRWPGWRRRALVLAALLGCIGILTLARWIAATPFVDAQWSAGGDGSLILEGSPLPALQALRGRTVVAIGGSGGSPMPVDAVLLHRSPRWQVNDAARERQLAQHEGLATLLAAGTLRLHFADGQALTLGAAPRGWAGLGWVFWPLAGLALLLLLSAVVVLLARPRPLNLLYALMALCQAGNLLFIALETTRGLGLPVAALAPEILTRLALDGCTGAAAVTAFALHPTHLPRAGWVAAAAWAAVIACLAMAWTGALSPLWWWVQGLCLALGAAALAVITRSYRREPNPYAMVLRRFAAATLATLLLVTAAVALAARPGEVAHGVAVAAPAAWVLFLASLLLLAPFSGRSWPLLREFALLSGIGTVAASLDLLFGAVFSIGAFNSLALALFIALTLYVGARQWVLNHVIGRSVLSTERTFELLYRAAREVQAQPARLSALQTRLLRELFEPLEVFGVDRVPARARVVGSGSALVVPMARADEDPTPPRALVLRYAQHGQRLFTLDDARLVDRVVDQMRRAVVYDQAVERGRNEERLRIAQDLHDDIGARLLTLMYQAPTPELEDYIRHTLLDLKTLTRGLAASEHRLSHAAVEWKADLAQRLTAAQAELLWTFHCDRDLQLSVVQWSALTRVLRELVSNALYHGHATRVEVQLGLERGQLLLRVADDGSGCKPQAWSHGLGLGGVRKRAKLLGGDVRWLENAPCGIACELRISGFGDLS
jgi:signal transduction histidine kinase